MLLNAPALQRASTGSTLVVEVLEDIAMRLQVEEP
jgi:hypothetical protein